MKRLSVWFWVAIAYLFATVSFNIATQWSAFPQYSTTDKLGVGLNLLLKSSAIALLIFRRRYGVYFLLAAFLIGLANTVWDFHIDGSWPMLPLVAKIGRVNGFIISAAIILYMYHLRGAGLLGGGSSSNLNPAIKGTFD